LNAPLAAASLKLAQSTANKKNLDKVIKYISKKKKKKKNSKKILISPPQKLEANMDTARKKHEALKAKKAKTAPEKLTAALNDEAEALVAFEDAQKTLEAELVRVNDAVCTDGATAMVALLCAHDVFLHAVSQALV
jgi:phosphatidate phosphatase APP1